MFQSWQKYFGAELWTDEYFDEYFAHSHKKRDEREAASSYVPERVQLRVAHWLKCGVGEL